MFVCCECCVLLGRGLCDGLIIRSEESYRLWRVVACDHKISQARRLKSARAPGEKKNITCVVLNVFRAVWLKAPFFRDMKPRHCVTGFLPSEGIMVFRSLEKRLSTDVV